MSRNRVWAALAVLSLSVFPIGCVQEVPPQPIEPAAAAVEAAPEPGASRAETADGEPESGEQLPPGHPPIGGEPALPPGHPPVGGEPAMPVGHPPVGGEAAAPMPFSEGKLRAPGVSFDLPEGWLPQTPASSMRFAQCALPGEAGAAELVVFYFGPDQGGPAAENIARWAGQFTAPDDPSQPATAETESFQQDGLQVTVVRVQGTYTPIAMGPMMPAPAPRAGQALYGVIVEGGPRGSVFVKVTGPAATLAAQREALDTFARSARKAG